jgi:signal transduction histidine kinase
LNPVTHILLVDDDEEDYLLTRDLLEDIPHKGYLLEWIPDYEEARAAIAENLHDVYLIDYRIGVHSGLQLIAEAVRQGCTGPMILLTGQADADTDEKALKAGAADYLVKGTFRPSDLERSIRYGMEHARHLREIRQLNVELEKRVEQRTQALGSALKKLEITNASLKKAEAEALKALEKERELNELKSRFVTTASHEFRTPLSTILSSASLIEKYNAPGDLDKRLKHTGPHQVVGAQPHADPQRLPLHQQARRGQGAPQPLRLDLPPFVEEVLEEMSALAKPGQRLQYRHAGPSPRLCTDKQSLRNVLINLISNAIKYSPEGKPVEVDSAQEDGQVTLTVRDHGIGIPAADQPHLFTRFYRAHNATNIQGTGLGSRL